MNPLPLPPTGPHFVGVIAAVPGAGLVWFLMTRPSIRLHLGRARLPLIFVLATGLLVLALLGNGVYGTAARGSAWTGAELPAGLGFSRDRVDRALKVGLSDEFVRYHFELKREELLFEPAGLEARVRWKWVDHSYAAARYGIQVAPRPPGSRILVFHYLDTHNFFFHLAGIGSDAMGQRFSFLQNLVHDYLDELVALEYLKHGDQPGQRVAALRMLRQGVPLASEWILRRLDRIPEDQLTPVVREEVAALRVLVQRYIDDPTLRGLPADTRVRLRPHPAPDGSHPGES